MAKRLKRKLCVCSLIDKIAIYGNNLAGEIYFKHSAKCKYKTSGTYEWIGAGYEKKGDPM